MNHGPPASASAPAKALAADNECAPTFVSISADDQTLYVACNHKGTLQVWDAEALTMRAEIPMGAGAYNVEPSPDGRFVVVTNKKAQSVSVVDVKSLKEVARIPTTKKIVHGVAFSPDSRYAYVTQESIGADPGAVDVIDLSKLVVVSTTPLPAQPTGITILQR
jgi:YVTN family beta-propeller protein